MLMGNWDRPELDRRAFMAGVVATAVVTGCSGGKDDGSGSAGGSTTTTAVAGSAGELPGNLSAEDVPPKETIYGWIEEVFDQGIRRPGYDADIWAEQFVADKFRELGLENVRMEPVPLTRWEPRTWLLEVTPAGGDLVGLTCYPVPYAVPADGLELELAAYDSADPGAVAGKASLYDVSLLEIPTTVFMGMGSAPEDTSDRLIDPDGTLSDSTQLVPFNADFQEVMAPSVEAGARAFIGALIDYPGNSYQYFVPYDGIEREIPGVWIRGTDGQWLHEQLANGPVHIKLTVDAVSEPFESHNVVGELPGADDDVVMIASHHDGPWASAVEDGSGIALVLAQATFWAAQPEEERAHRLVFVLQAGHMCGGAGLRRYIEDHRSELERVVLEVHLEHAALEFTAAEEHEVVTTDQPVPRWFFTSRIPPLEEAVIEALTTEELGRSMVLAPDAILGPQPPTDGAFYHIEGVPIFQFLAAPFYLFDAMDILDKIDQEHLVPLTRATIRVIESTRGTSAAAMRAAAV
jgi:hypothetical protein